jgi:malonyl-CoA O-methyltransferase
MWRRSSSHNLLRRAYAAWAPRYDVGPGNPVQRANDLALAVCVPKAPVRGVALDVACGTGRHAVLLQARGWERRFAFDLSPEMLDRAENYQGRAVADLRHVPCRPVELVMCSLAVGHLRNLEASLDELCNLVRRNGDLVISDIHPRAVASGLKRAFSGEDGRAWRLPHTVHRIEQVVEALEKRGLSTLLISEPAPEPPLRGEPKHPNVPLVYALRARRLGD